MVRTTQGTRMVLGSSRLQLTRIPFWSAEALTAVRGGVASLEAAVDNGLGNLVAFVYPPTGQPHPRSCYRQRSLLAVAILEGCEESALWLAQKMLERWTAGQQQQHHQQQQQQQQEDEDEEDEEEDEEDEEEEEDEASNPLCISINYSCWLPEDELRYIAPAYLGPNIAEWLVEVSNTSEQLLEVSLLDCAEGRCAERCCDQRCCAERRCAERRCAEHRCAERRCAERRCAERRCAERRCAERRPLCWSSQGFTHKLISFIQCCRAPPTVHCSGACHQFCNCCWRAE